MNKSTKWFLVILGILLLIGSGAMLFFFIVISSLSQESADVVTGSGEKIAVIELKGVILSSDEIVRQFKKYSDDHSVRAILFRVDSPGGGVVASQEIYEQVKKTRRGGKPVVVSMGSLGASGGYYVSCAANKIMANPGTLTGSIGVISQFMRFDSLFGKIGVSVNTIKSGKFKDAGNPFRRMTDDDKQYFQNLMDDVHHQFIAAVEHERELDHDSVVRFADGRVFTGEQALKMKLVDTLGTYEDAIALAGKLGGIKHTPATVQEHKLKSVFERMFGETKISDFLGLKEDLLNQPILQYRMIQGF